MTSEPSDTQPDIEFADTNPAGKKQHAINAPRKKPRRGGLFGCSVCPDILFLECSGYIEEI
ncbi:MAG: hypothetical protein A2948_01110 [Candidatus Lloydbacteria bacterium RIFCSPLOWO2_01_FULL_54_18]|nr:MAG: hypothetical protein A2948_01110 [Candidatus Lloydbacteria bacterium RIFCSPLOWO2_01_FULL_54_18]